MQGRECFGIARERAGTPSKCEEQQLARCKCSKERAGAPGDRMCIGIEKERYSRHACAAAKLRRLIRAPCRVSELLHRRANAATYTASTGSASSVTAI